MEYPATTREAFENRPRTYEEWLVVGAAVGLTVGALLSPLALPLAVTSLVFVLAALRFRPLFLIVVFFLPITPFLNWNFPVRDLSTLVRFSFFAGVVLYRMSHREDLRGWLWSGWLTRAVLGYCGVAFVSAVFFNPLTLDAQRELMRLASYVCFYYIVTDWLQNDQDTRALLKVLMASTLVASLFGFYQAITGGYTAIYDILYPVQEEIAQIPAWEGRITSFLEHYNGLAGYLNLVTPFCLGFALRGKDPVVHRLSWWCLGLASLALLLTQSRGGLLAYAAILLMGAWFFAPDRKTRIRRVAIVLVFCVVAAAVAGLFFHRLTEIDDFTTVSRVAIWGGAFTVFTRAPALGIGFGNLRGLMGGLLNLPDGWTGDAHNLYLELLAETGIVGFVAFALLAGVAMRGALRRYRRSQDEFRRILGFAIFAALASVLLHGTVDYLFHTTPQVAALFFLVLGVLRAQGDGETQVAC
jgi:putative inorganic carbon (HCO3(-)) transporter